MQIPVLTKEQAAFKERIDEELRTYCKQRAKQAGLIHERYELLWRSIESLLLAGGKRLRSYLLLTAFEAYCDDQGARSNVLSAAVAIELLHMAMLIHDDIIDRDMIRYGVKNIAGQYEDIYAPLAAELAEVRHLSLSSVLLAGDILLSDAHRLIKEVDRPEVCVSAASELLSKAVFEVVGGELLDGEAAFLPVGIIQPELVAQYKTASYSFAAPLTIGAALANAPEPESMLLAKLSDALGLGYQLRDDVLGMFGDEQKTGKSSSSDLEEGRRTALVTTFDALASDDERRAFYELFHKSNLTSEQITTARQLLMSSGALQAIEDRIEALIKESQTIIEALGVADQYKETLHAFVNNCLKRER